MSKNKRWARHRLNLFLEQLGKCYWCGCQMILPREALPPNTPEMCTVDHLRDRFDPTRSEPQPPGGGSKRHVAACFTCNQRRSHESIQANMEEHKRRCVAGHERASLTSASDTAQQTQVITT